jgi:hypothetical protein
MILRYIPRFIVILVLLLVIAIGESFFQSWYISFFKGPKDSLETQLRKTVQALQANSQQATDLVLRLQSEVANRTQALKDLEFQLA